MSRGPGRVMREITRYVESLSSPRWIAIDELAEYLGMNTTRAGRVSVWRAMHSDARTRPGIEVATVTRSKIDIGSDYWTPAEYRGQHHYPLAVRRQLVRHAPPRDPDFDRFLRRRAAGSGLVRHALTAASHVHQSLGFRPTRGG